MIDNLKSGKGTNTISPKEFLFKYIRFSPWIILSVVAFLVAAYIKLRYTLPFMWLRVSF